ncbi:MAG: ArgR family transcriptional regulator [Tannerella sp.]|jgi:transcriptional regulator of arginine metabolism|nr:ArgR family transcriptional regulator [Tannerella sp.]
MKAKNDRQREIEQIVRTEAITCQEDLHKSLENRGIYISQATLSRDVKNLKIIKIHDDKNRYLYVLPDMTKQRMTKQNPEVKIGSTIEFSGNFAVIKTRPGYAMGIASDIDESTGDEIIGTLAGDDTILVIPRDGYSKTQIINALEKYIQ